MGHAPRDPSETRPPASSATAHGSRHAAHRRARLAQKNLNLDSKVTIQKAYSDYIVSNGASS
ncbi:hypothetical protein ACWDXT_35400, partial [Streptomyces sp. NPDC003236]